MKLAVDDAKVTDPVDVDVDVDIDDESVLADGMIPEAGLLN